MVGWRWRILCASANSKERRENALKQTPCCFSRQTERNESMQRIRSGSHPLACEDHESEQGTKTFRIRKPGRNKEPKAQHLLHISGLVASFPMSTTWQKPLPLWGLSPLLLLLSISAARLFPDYKSSPPTLQGCRKVFVPFRYAYRCWWEHCNKFGLRQRAADFSAMRQ